MHGVHIFRSSSSSRGGRSLPQAVCLSHTPRAKLGGGEAPAQQSAGQGFYAAHACSVHLHPSPPQQLADTTATQHHHDLLAAIERGMLIPGQPDCLQQRRVCECVTRAVLPCVHVCPCWLCHLQVLNTEASTEALLPYIKVFQSLIRSV